MLVHIQGAANSPCCSCYALNRASIDQKDMFSDLAVQTVLKNFYMDDLIKTVKTETDAVKLIHELISMLQSRGFNLTKFNSNSKKVVSAIPEDKRSQTSKNTLKFEDEITRALGIKWDLN